MKELHLKYALLVVFDLVDLDSKNIRHLDLGKLTGVKAGKNVRYIILAKAT